MRNRRWNAKQVAWPVLASLFLAILVGQINEFGATWDEFLYFKGVRGVVRHGIDVLMGRSPNIKDIFGDLALFGHTSRFVPFLLSQSNALQVSNLESLTDAQKYLLGSFTILKHLSSVAFGWITGCLLSVVTWRSDRRYLSTMVFFLVLLLPEWTGSSFFNNSDIPQAFIFTCFSLTWAIQGWLLFVEGSPDRKRLLMWSSTAGVWAGLSISTRPGSVVFVCVYYVVLFFLVYLSSKRKKWRLMSISVTISAVVANIAFYLTYPQGWGRWPWQSVYQAVSYISDRQKKGVFQATAYVANQLYESLPLLYVVGLVSLIFFSLTKLMKSRMSCGCYISSVFQDKWAWVYFSMFLQLAVPVIMVSISGTVLYGRLRHIMLVYPALAMLSTLGLQLVLTGKSTSTKRVCRVVIVAIAAITFTEFVLLSPYQYTYKSDVSRLMDLGLGNVQISRSRYYGLNNDYYGASQKHLFGFCVADKSCLSELVNRPDGVRQTNGIKVDGGSFNKELFEAYRLLFLKPERERQVLDRDVPEKSFYQFNTNKFREIETAKCTITNSLTRQILVPVKKVSIGELLLCN